MGSSSKLRGSAMSEWEIRDIRKRFTEGEDKLIIQSIFPRGGPIYGQTKVHVRADGLE